MDNKQIREDKIAAEEILSDTELDSVAGGGQTGTGDTGNFDVFESNPKSNPVPSDLTNTVLVFGQLGPG